MPCHVRQLPMSLCVRQVLQAGCKWHDVHVPFLCLPCRSADVTLRITFADAASVPRLVRLEHAPTPTAAFERLGDIRLQAKSLTQLKHLFRCAALGCTCVHG